MLKLSLLFLIIKVIFTQNLIYIANQEHAFRWLGGISATFVTCFCCTLLHDDQQYWSISNCLRQDVGYAPVLHIL